MERFGVRQLSLMGEGMTERGKSQNFSSIWIDPGSRQLMLNDKEGRVQGEGGGEYRVIRLKRLLPASEAGRTKHPPGSPGDTCHLLEIIV